MSQTSKSSQFRTEFARIALLRALERRHARSGTQWSGSEVRLMGHSPSPRRAWYAFPFDAAPPPSLETTDALRRRRPIEEAGTRARLSF